MTCIVGVLGPGGAVHLGGDSAGVSGLDVVVRGDEKVFRNGPYLVGVCGSFRLMDLLRDVFVPPDRGPAERHDGRWLRGPFVDALRRCLKEAGYAERCDEAERLSQGSAFLLGYAGRLYTVYSDYQVGVNRCGFAAVGCGEDYALGSLHSTAGRALAPRARLLAALKAAAEFSGGVRPPFVLRSLPPPKKGGR